MSIVSGKTDGLLLVGEAVCFFRYLCVSLRLSAGEADLQHVRRQQLLCVANTSVGLDFKWRSETTVL